MNNVVVGEKVAREARVARPAFSQEEDRGPMIVEITL